MPKMKTHSGAAKRFKMTGTGKLRAPQGVPQAHAREEAVDPHPPARSGEVERHRRRRDRDQAPARPLSPVRLTRHDRKERTMARVKRAVHSKKHRRADLERAKGYYGNKSRSYRAANEQVMHSLQYAFRDRRARKGEFRKLWIQRINAACRQNGISYSRFIAGLKARGRGRPQGPRRPRRHRPGGVRRAGEVAKAAVDQTAAATPQRSATSGLAAPLTQPPQSSAAAPRREPRRRAGRRRVRGRGPGRSLRRGAGLDAVAARGVYVGRERCVDRRSMACRLRRRRRRSAVGAGG